MEAPIRASLLRGVSWFGTFAVIQKAIRFTAGLLVARLIGPDSFGLFAIGLLVVALPDEILRFPIGDAIVRKQEVRREYIDMAWTTSLRRVPIALLVFLLAPTVAIFFEAPQALAVTRWIAVGYAIASFESPGVLVSRIKLDFKRLALFPHLVFWIEIVSTLAAAYAFRNVYALIVGMWAKSIATVVLSYAMFPSRPRLVWDLAVFKTFWPFSKWVWTERVSKEFSIQSVSALVGKMLDSVSLGIYSKSRSLAQAPLELLRLTLEPVLFPSYSAMKDDLAKIRRYNRTLIAAYLVIGTFLAGVTYLLSGVFVPMVLGDAWLGMVPLLQAYTPIFLLQGPILVLGPSVFKGIGRPDVIARILLTHAGLLFLFSFLGIRWFGIVGAIYGLVLTLLIDFAVWSFYMVRLKLFNYGWLLRLLGPAVILLLLGLMAVPHMARFTSGQLGLGAFQSTLVLGLITVFYFAVTGILLLTQSAYRELRTQVSRIAAASLGDARQIRFPLSK